MYKATINKKQTLSIKQDKDQFIINDTAYKADIKELSADNYHIITKDGHSYSAELIAFDATQKSAVVNINGNKYTVELKDKFDELLQSLGMDGASSHKINDIKAPMPGLVLKVLVEDGSEVKKDDALVVLEAMKMENIIKSPSDGIVKSVKIKEKETVEKNQVMIAFK
ncbi:Glutaconyl-CoA decarboxylase subunit gamma [compost metagenome]